MRCIIAFGFVLVVTGQAAAAETQAPDSGGLESLGRELLDDLAPDMLGEPATSPEAPTVPAPRVDDLGEDIGHPSGPLALARVRHSMQQAEALLARRLEEAEPKAVVEANEVQQKVLEQLDELIAQLSKQCQGGQCQPGDKQPKPNQQAQKKPGTPGGTGGRGQSAARDSSSRLSQSRPGRAAEGDARTVVKDLWGHLPERSRERMLQSFSAEFLPEYAAEIEQYYRRLSEEQQAQRPDPPPAGARSTP